MYQIFLATNLSCLPKKHMSNLHLSVIIPAYNESTRIEKTISSLEAYFANKTYAYEIIVVDDGSKDNTAEVARIAGTRLPLRVIQNDRNRGKGYSVKNGMHNARGDYRLFMDADNSVDILHLDEFMPQIEAGYDVVIGSIAMDEAKITEGAGKHRRLLGSFAKYLIRFLSVPGIRDTQRGFKLFSSEAADLIFPLQTIDRFGFDIEILVIAWINGLKIRELPVTWDNPGGSTVTLSSYVYTLKELVHISFNRLFGAYRRSAITAQIGM